MDIGSCSFEHADHWALRVFLSPACRFDLEIEQLDTAIVLLNDNMDDYIYMHPPLDLYIDS